MPIEIPLASPRAKQLGFIALIDEEDVELVRVHLWTVMAQKNVKYARSRFADGRSLLMHRYLMGLEPGDPRLVDHRDGNGLNNTRGNLRICDRSENAFNRDLRDDAARGTWLSPSGRWCAEIRKDGQKFKLGTFETQSEAVAAFVGAGTVLYGKFANRVRRSEG